MSAKPAPKRKAVALDELAVDASAALLHLDVDVVAHKDKRRGALAAKLERVAQHATRLARQLRANTASAPKATIECVPPEVLELILGYATRDAELDRAMDVSLGFVTRGSRTWVAGVASVCRAFAAAMARLRTLSLMVRVDAPLPEHHTLMQWPNARVAKLLSSDDTRSNCDAILRLLDPATSKLRESVPQLEVVVIPHAMEVIYGRLDDAGGQDELRPATPSFTPIADAIYIKHYNRTTALVSTKLLEAIKVRHLQTSAFARCDVGHRYSHAGLETLSVDCPYSYGNTFPTLKRYLFSCDISTIILQLAQWPTRFATVFPNLENLCYIRTNVGEISASGVLSSRIVENLHTLARLWYNVTGRTRPLCLDALLIQRLCDIAAVSRAPHGDALKHAIHLFLSTEPVALFFSRARPESACFRRQPRSSFVEGLAGYASMLHPSAELRVVETPFMEYLTDREPLPRATMREFGAPADAVAWLERNLTYSPVFEDTLW